MSKSLRESYKEADGIDRFLFGLVVMLVGIGLVVIGTGLIFTTYLAFHSCVP